MKNLDLFKNPDMHKLSLKSNFNFNVSMLWKNNEVTNGQRKV